MSSGKDKETLMGHLIPDPTATHAPRRTGSTAIIVLFFTTVAWIAWHGNGPARGVEQGVDWINYRSVEWGNRQALASGAGSELYSGVEDADEDAAEDDQGTTEIPAETYTNKAVDEEPEDAVTGPSEGVFAADVADRVNARKADGTLARYVWHEQLTKADWSKDGHSSLVVVGDIHGQNESLATLLSRVSPSSSSPRAATLLHTGDLISKAPLNASLATVAYVRTHGMKGVRGNHDQGVIEWREWMEAYGQLLKRTAATTATEDTPPSRFKPKTKPKGGKAQAWAGYGVKGQDIPSIDEASSYAAADSKRRKNAAGLRGSRGAAVRVAKRSWWSSSKPSVSDAEDVDEEATLDDLSELGGGEYGPIKVDDGEATPTEDEESEPTTSRDAEGYPIATGTSVKAYGRPRPADLEDEGEGQDEDEDEEDLAETATASTKPKYAMDDATTTATTLPTSTRSSITHPSSFGRAHRRPRPTAAAVNANSNANSTSSANSTTSPHSSDESTRTPALGTSTFWSDKDAGHGVDHATLESAGGLVGFGWEWLELSESEVKALGVDVPAGWEWGGAWFEIARHLPRDDYEYLAALPLTLYVESLNSYVVHAGMLPWVDTRDAVSSTPSSSTGSLPSPLLSTSLTTFEPSTAISSLLREPSHSLLLVPQNSAPFTLLNMRGVRQRGKVYLPQKEKTGKQWHAIWNDFWETCDEEQNGRCQKIGVIYGHWAGAGLTVKPQSIGLDSGCAAGNRLSALVISPGSTNSPLTTSRSASRASHPRSHRFIPSSHLSKRTRMQKRAWGWSGARPKPALLASDEDSESVEVPDTADEVIEVEIESEAEVTEAEEHSIDAEKVAVVDASTPFEEEEVEFGGVDGWVVSVKCGGD
ncbi:hypothetical protein RQP46_003535 [Phenoliferia psychrophenolica]